VAVPSFVAQSAILPHGQKKWYSLEQNLELDDIFDYYNRCEWTAGGRTTLDDSIDLLIEELEVDILVEVGSFWSLQSSATLLHEKKVVYFSIVLVQPSGTLLEKVEYFSSFQSLAKIHEEVEYWSLLYSSSATNAARKSRVPRDGSVVFFWMVHRMKKLASQEDTAGHQMTTKLLPSGSQLSTKSKRYSALYQVDIPVAKEAPKIAVDILPQLLPRIDSIPYFDLLLLCLFFYSNWNWQEAPFQLLPHLAKLDLLSTRNNRATG
jgi:hypothetical protein